MQIRFQGNYQVLGPTREGIEAKINQLEQENPIAISVVAQTAPCDGPTCNRNAAYGGYMLTGEDAVSFLGSQGIQAEFTDNKADNDRKIDDGLKKIADKKAFSEALCFTSMSLRFMQDLFTEIQLVQ